MSCDAVIPKIRRSCKGFGSELINLLFVYFFFIIYNVFESQSRLEKVRYKLLFIEEKKYERR